MPTIKERMAELIGLSKKKIEEINARPKTYAGYNQQDYYNRTIIYDHANLPGIQKPVLVVGDACQIKAYSSTGFEKGCGVKVNNMMAILISLKNDNWMSEVAFVDRDKLLRDNTYVFDPCRACAKGPCKTLSLYSNDLQFMKKTKYQGEKP